MIIKDCFSLLHGKAQRPLRVHFMVKGHAFAVPSRFKSDVFLLISSMEPK